MQHGFMNFVRYIYEQTTTAVYDSLQRYGVID